jgi:hypothetical protein
MDALIIDEPTGPARGRPDDKLRDAVLRTAKLAHNDEKKT